MKTYELTEDQRKLAEENVKLVPFALNRFFGYELAKDEDMQSIGNIGLCIAAATYDPSRKASFSTYAVTCIANEIRKHFQLAHKKSRYDEVPPISLNIVVRSNYDDDPQELMKLIPDERVNVENDALNHVLYEQALNFTPTHYILDCKGLTMGELAKIQGVKKRSLHARMLNEYARARRALLKGETTVIAI